jgi:hypothetical protein
VFSSNITTPGVLHSGALKQDKGTPPAWHIRRKQQVPPQWNPESLQLYPNKKSRQQVCQEVPNVNICLRTKCWK